MTYVTLNTTTDEIKREITKIEIALESDRLPKHERTALHEALNYLYSFLPTERW